MPRNTAQALADARRARQEIDREIARLHTQLLAESHAKRLEPADKSVVRFRAAYPSTLRVYTFAAIRCDNWRRPTLDRPGHPRWFISQNNDLDKPVTIVSPATWLELVQLAVEGSIEVAQEVAWDALSNLRAPETSQKEEVRLGDAGYDMEALMRNRIPGYGY